MNLHWRLFEEKDGELYSLFHGVHGSRRVAQGVWLEARVRSVRDGAGDKWYPSGWHVFTDESGLEYLGRFRKPRRLVAVQVEVQNTWVKPTNPSILLAKWMRVPADGERRVVREAHTP